MSELRVGTVISGKWQVDARVGAGGMATVYAVTHRNGQRGALKMLHGALSRDPSTRARFLREGYVANSVGHPGVVAVLDDGVAEDGSAFLVLELLEGETIEARRTRGGGSLPVDQVLDLADQALDALAAAHEKGVVHRDVKPENVFITKQGKVKLLDFGLARMRTPDVETTKTGVTIGTPEFMPPEQAAGRRDAVDARSDVWGLAATMFTMITGRYVHENANSVQEQIIASRTRRSRPIRQLAPHVTPEVAKVIDRALELEMEDRWQSAREMQAALREARGSDFAPDSNTMMVAPTDDTLANTGETVVRESTISTEKTINWAGSALPPRRIEDATDMEVTFVEKPSPRAQPIAPKATRMRDPRQLPPFRARIQTPSENHATIPAAPPSDPLPSRPSRPAHLDLSDNDGETTRAETPEARRDVGPDRPTPRPARIEAPRPALAPRLAIEPAMAQPPVMPPPAPLPPAYPHPPPMMLFQQPPDEQRNSRDAVMLVALILITVCAAMGAYVLWHRRSASSP